MTKVTDLQEAQGAVQVASGTSGAGTNTQLLTAIGQALAVGGPVGSPAVIRERAKAYNTAAGAYGSASDDLSTVATDQLPSAWTGSVAETAAQAVQAMANELSTSSEALAQAATLLGSWADDLAWAQSTDAAGIASLRSAARTAQGDSLRITPDPAATSAALSGVANRLAAAQKAEASATHTASALRQLDAGARAQRAGRGPLDPLGAVVLANDKGPGGASDDGPLLSPEQLTRATQILGTLSPSDQAAFQLLLSGAKSPDEAAYLYKALAAGHSVSEVQQFDALIHAHGDEPTWLSDHLVPALSRPPTELESDTRTTLTYQGWQFDANGLAPYGQGDVNDCVAASTVVAQARLDPVLMLKLTTGNTPDAPGADSLANFQQRLRQEYVANYHQGQRAEDAEPYPKSDGGLGSTGENVLADQDLGKATGATYQYVSLGSDSDRQAALTRIEQAVDAGEPVPINVGDGGSLGHQMMIIGRNGTMLEVYNPWGFSSWVSEDQFVHSQLGSLTPGANFNNAYGLELPK